MTARPLALAMALFVSAAGSWSLAAGARAASVSYSALAHLGGAPSPLSFQMDLWHNNLMESIAYSRTITAADEGLTFTIDETNSESEYGNEWSLVVAKLATLNFQTARVDLGVSAHQYAFAHDVLSFTLDRIEIAVEGFTPVGNPADNRHDLYLRTTIFGEGEVPEPAAGVLAALGLAAWALRRR